MITREQFAQAQQTGKELLEKSGVFVKAEEFSQIAVADFGLSDLAVFGAQILTLVDTEKISTKLIALHPGQILPEHWHPKIGDYPGKEETLRVEWGELFLYTPGQPAENPRATVPKDKLDCFKNWHENSMKPGDQLLLPPGTPHWFYAGPQGVVVWSFSTTVLDLQDNFSDPEIRRVTVISDEQEK